MEEIKEQVVCKWLFDHWSTAHWDEVRQGKIDKKSWVELSETDAGLCGLRAKVFTNQTQGLTIDAERDQWGTWITFSIGDAHHTIAQEDGTMSFLDAMIAALTKLKELDFETTPPVEEKTDALSENS